MKAAPGYKVSRVLPEPSSQLLLRARNAGVKAAPGYKVSRVLPKPSSQLLLQATITGVKATLRYMLAGCNNHGLFGQQSSEAFLGSFPDSHAWTEASLCVQKLIVLLATLASTCNVSFFFRMLFKNGLFPNGTRIVGYARSTLTIDQLKERCKQYLKVGRIWLPWLLHFLLL